jgi:hypothetical protein
MFEQKSHHSSRIFVFRLNQPRSYIAALSRVSNRRGHAVQNEQSFIGKIQLLVSPLLDLESGIALEVERESPNASLLLL